MAVYDRGGALGFWSRGRGQRQLAWPDDVAALMEDADEQLQVIRTLHDQALADAAVRQRFKTRIKNVLENHRSALDYLAVGITNAYGTPKGFIYFPLAQSEHEFPAEMEKKMPGVMASRPNIAGALRQYQPYQPGRDWLHTLNQLTREQKHNELSAQIVREVYQCRVTEKATGAAVQWYGLRFEVGRIVSSGGAIIPRPELNRPPSAPKPIEVGVGPTGTQIFGVPIDPTTQRPYPDPRLDVESGQFQQWCFLTPHIAILDLLNESRWGVVTIVQAVRDAL